MVAHDTRRYDIPDSHLDDQERHERRDRRPVGIRRVLGQRNDHGRDRGDDRADRRDEVEDECQHSPCESELDPDRPKRDPDAQSGRRADEELEQIAGGEIVSRVPCDVCRSQKGDPACKECPYNS